MYSYFSEHFTNQLTKFDPYCELRGYRISTFQMLVYSAISNYPAFQEYLATCGLMQKAIQLVF